MQCFILISLKKTAKNSEVDAHDICVLSFTSVGQSTILRASECMIIEIKIHVYGKRQTSDSSWGFLKTENKQIKTTQNNSYELNWRETTYFLCRSNQQETTIKGKTWSGGRNSRLPFGVNLNLSYKYSVVYARYWRNPLILSLQWSFAFFVTFQYLLFKWYHALHVKCIKTESTRTLNNFEF